MKPYYIGIGGLSLLVVIVLLINIIGTTALKADFKLEDKLQEIQSSITTHVNSSKKLPEVLLDVGVKESGGVEYKKISDSRYMLCATFKTKSDGYRAPETAYVEDLKSQSADSGVALTENTHFTDGDREGLKHEKGYGCIVYKPYLLNDAYSKPYSVCGGRYKRLLSDQKIVSVDAARKSITSTQNYETNNSRGTTSYAVNKTYYLTSTTIYSSSCKKLTISDLKEGDAFKLYYDSSYTLPGAIQLTTQSTTQPIPNTQYQ